MAYPVAPSPFLRSGWNSSMLIPNPEYHASALSYLGGSAPPTQAAPAIQQRYFSGASNPTIGGLNQFSGSQYSPPDWLSRLLFGGGLPGVNGTQPGNGQIPSWVSGQQVALQQVANAANTNPTTPQSGVVTQPKKKGGLFSTILGINDPGAAALFGI